jgi:predicted ATPase
MDAASMVRSTSEDGAGEPRSLFANSQPESGPMRFCAEMIVPAEVADDFGDRIAPSISFLRYEVSIGFESQRGPQRSGRLYVEQETLEHINRGDAGKHLGFVHAKTFRSHVVTGRRAGGPFISTEAAEQRITVHQDGGSRGRPKRALPTRAGTTVVSTINSIDAPTILAARREMQSWRRLALEPSALRAANRYSDPDSLGHDGHNLASTLHRIATTPDAEGAVAPTNVYARVAERLRGLSGLSLTGLRVDNDDSRQLLTVVVVDRDGNELPARSLSEGTLRYLALCVMLEDPNVTGLICMEEPENGIHPGNLAEMVQLVQDLAVDPSVEPGPGNPLRQVIVNSHSPAVVQLLHADDLLLATEQLRRVQDGHLARSLRVEGAAGTWRAGRNGMPGALRASFIDYLTPPPDAQFKLFNDVA